MRGTAPGSGVPPAAISGQSRRDLRLVCLGVAGMTTATALVGLSVALHLRPVGSLAVAAGLAATILPAATGALWAGPLVDRHRTRPLVALAGAVSAVALVVAALTALDDGRTLWLLFLAMVTGASVAVISPALSALVPALVGEEASTRG